MSKKQDNPIIAKAEQFLNKYATFAEDYYTFPLALWCIATHTFPTFDCFPYLVITAYVKRAGKTRAMELAAKISSNGRTYSPDSPASMFRDLSEFAPTIFIDEAEKLNQENHPAREFLNKGYKKGQTIPRVLGNKVVNFDCFGPKCFVLIGDVYDTLRDRSICITMRRRTPVEAASEVKYRDAIVTPESEQLREEISNAIQENQAEIEKSYLELEPLNFLNDRDEELWGCLFAVAKVFCPSRMQELTKAAVDIATEKTQERRSYHELLDTEEKKADDAEAAVILLRDMLTLLDGKKYIASADLVERLKDITTSPWRRFRGGDGLTMQTAALLLDGLNVHPKVIRVGKNGEKKSTARGYTKDDIVAAAKLVGLR